MPTSLGIPDKFPREHLDALKKKAELREIGMDNIRENLSRARRLYNQGKAESLICKGDEVMLRRSTISDGLTEKFNGPYEVLERGVRMLTCA